MLLEKYMPESIDSMISNKEQINTIREWIKNWKKGSLIVYGPTGSGKTLTVKLIARELNYELADCDFDEEAMLKASKQKSLFFRNKLIIIDELHSIKPRQLQEIIKKSSYPVILITEDPFEKRLRPIRISSKLVKFNKIRSNQLAALLKRVCIQEGSEYDQKALDLIARINNGDIRSALIDLETLPRIDLNCVKNIGHREHEENVFNTLKIIFKTSDLFNIRTALNNSEKPPEELFRWIEENISAEYKDIKEIANAYDYLSKSDIFASRIIKRQAWSLQKYIFLFAYGTALSKQKAKSGFTMYKYPKIFYSKNNGIEEKIAKKLHISTKEAKQYTELINLIIKKNPSAIQELGLSEDDLEEIN